MVGGFIESPPSISMVRVAVSFSSDEAVPEAENARSEVKVSVFCCSLVSCFPFDFLVITAVPVDSSSLSATSLFLLAVADRFGFLNIERRILLCHKTSLSTFNSNGIRFLL